MERTIRDKDLYIYELQDQIKEKEERLYINEKDIAECKKKLTEMNALNERANEYDALLEKYERSEKQRAFYEEKCNKNSEELKELNILREQNAAINSRIDKLIEELKQVELHRHNLSLEVRRLNNIENIYNEEKHYVKAKEEEICILIREKCELTNKVKSLNEKLRLMKNEYDQRIDLLEGNQAQGQSIINSLNGRIQQLNEEKEEMKNQANKLEKLKNELIDKYEIEFQTANKTHSDEISSMSAKINELERQKSLLEGETKSFSDELHSKESELMELRRVHDTTKQQYSSDTTKLLAEMDDLMRKLRDRERTIQRFETLNSELESTIKADKDAAERRVKELVQKKEGEKAQLQDQISRLNQQLDERSNALNELGLKLSATQSQHKIKLEESNEKIEQLHKQLEYNKMNLIKQEEEWRAELDQKLTESNRLNKQIEEYLAQIENLNDQLINVTNEKQTLTAKFDDIEILYKEEKNKLETANMQITSLNNEVTKIKKS
jgi:chromosome segregation ATPase